MGKQEKAPFEDLLKDRKLRAGARKVLRAAVRHLPEDHRQAVIGLVDDLAKSAAQHAKDCAGIASLLRGVGRAPKTNGGPKSAGR